MDAGSDVDIPDSTHVPAPDSGTLPLKPVWNDVPKMEIATEQGITTAIPMSLSIEDSSTISVEVVAESGIEVEYIAQTSELHVRPGYQLAGKSTITVTLVSDKNVREVYSISLKVRGLSWGASSVWKSSNNEGPQAREHLSWVVDNKNQQAYLFGGSGYAPYLAPLEDEWVFDLPTKTWKLVPTSAGEVPEGGSRRVVQDPSLEHAYVFGGYGENDNVFNSLYQVDVENGRLKFVELQQVNPPSGRSLHGFAYEPTTRRFIVFGGTNSGSTKVYRDTYLGTLNGNVMTWTAIQSTPGTQTPSSRYGFFFAMNPESGELFLYSGAQGLLTVNPAQDTWRMDATKANPVWKRVLNGSADGVPPGRRNGASVYDPRGQRMFVFGGTSDAKTSQPGVFVLDMRPGKTKWEKVPTSDGPKSRSSGAGLYDPTNQRVWFGFGNDSVVFRDMTPLGVFAN
jgi:hypothetical protein